MMPCQSPLGDCGNRAVAMVTYTYFLTQERAQIAVCRAHLDWFLEENQSLFSTYHTLSFRAVRMKEEPCD